MISLRKLLQKPGSPDIALVQAPKDESALARIAHVNRLAKDIYDVLPYTLDYSTSPILQIDSKKGIVEIINAPAIDDTLTIYLENPEMNTLNKDKYYIQLTAYCSNSFVTPIIYGRGIVSSGYHIEIKNLDAATSWEDLYFYYDLLKLE
jgi:hypothetical protein